MKRDNKIIKQILIDLRDIKKDYDLWDDDWQKELLNKYDVDELQEHFKLLFEDNLIEAIDTSTKDSRSINPKRLTSYGHDYLEELLTPWWKSIWRNILDATSKTIYSKIGYIISLIFLLSIVYLLNKI